MKSSQSLVLALALVLFAAPVWGQTNEASAVMPCSDILAGQRYAFVFQGFFDLGNGTGLAPNVGGGIIRFDHHGRFFAVANLNLGGVFISDYFLQGTYAMQEDTRTQPPVCAGNVTADSGPTFQFLASRDGAVLEQMHTDQGLVVVVTSLLMERGPCTDATLHGTYLYSANGYFATSGPMQPFGSYTPFAFSGAVSFDGRGHLTGWDTVSLAGLIVPRTYSGTFHMSPDCTATAQFHDSLGNDAHTVNYLYKGGKAMAVVNVNTDGSTMLAFNATRE